MSYPHTSYSAGALLPAFAQRAARLALASALCLVAIPAGAEPPALPPAPAGAPPPAIAPAPTTAPVPVVAPVAPQGRVLLDLRGRADVSQVWVDGRSLDPAAWERPIELPTGEHTLRFAGRERAVEQRITLREGDTLPVYVEALVASPQGPVADDKPSRPSALHEEGAAGQRVTGYLLAGLGVASLGVCAVFGGQAVAEKSSADALYAARRPEYLESDAAASRDAAISTAALGVGLVALAAGAVVVFTGRDRVVSAAPTTARARAVARPTLTLSSGGLRGAF